MVEQRLDGLRPGVVGRVGVGVVAQALQHGGDFSHVAHHVRGDVAHPRGEGVRVDGLHHLVCGALHPAATSSVGQFSWSVNVQCVKSGLNYDFYEGKSFINCLQIH